MKADAQWNKDLRDQRLSEYLTKDEKEKGEAPSDGTDARFLSDMKKTAYSDTQRLEDRLHRNKHAIQKTEVSQAKFTDR